MNSTFSQKLIKLTGKKSVVLFIITVTAFAVYFKITGFQLTGSDDKLLIAGSLKAKNILSAFTEPYIFSDGLFYRPVVTLSFYIISLIQNDTLYFQYLLNIFLHIASAFAFYAFLIKLKTDSVPAFFVSILFTVHPLYTNAVAWLPGRNDILLSLFIFLSFIYLLKYISNSKPGYLVIFSALFLCALLTKESAAAAALLFLLYMFMFARDTFMKRKYDILISAALPVLIWFLLRKNAVTGSVPIELFKNQVYYLQALGKIILPFNLTVLPDIADTTFTYGIISLCIVALLFFISTKRNSRLFIFGISWFVIFVFVSVINTNPEYSHDLMLESRLYLPSAGIFIALLQTDFVKIFNFKKAVFSTAALIIIAGLIYLSFRYSCFYKDQQSYWEEAVTGSPSLDLSYAGLGSYYFIKEDFNSSIENYKKAAEIFPGKTGYNSKIAFSYLRLDNTDEAEIYYRRELAVNPNDFDANLLVGVILFKKNKLSESENFFLTAQKINPGDVQPVIYLAKLYNSAGDSVKAGKYSEILKQKGIKIPETDSGDNNHGR